jgi:hypothetical protein
MDFLNRNVSKQPVRILENSMKPRPLSTGYRKEFFGFQPERRGRYRGVRSKLGIR